MLDLFENFCHSLCGYSTIQERTRLQFFLHTAASTYFKYAVIFAVIFMVNFILFSSNFIVKCFCFCNIWTHLSTLTITFKRTNWSFQGIQFSPNKVPSKLSCFPSWNHATTGKGFLDFDIHIKNVKLFSNGSNKIFK